MKNKDLQGLRGISVILVLIFHLNPKEYRLGFIGVDMFFVLSGYFMSIILNKERLSLLKILDFYSRRFKRIVPIFYIMLAMVYIVCALLLILPDRKGLVVDLKWALSFTSNIQLMFERYGYWDQISSYRFLLHSWSLGVELQFYAIAPLLFGSVLVEKRRRKLFTLIMLSLLSLGVQLLSPPKVAYGLLISRIWQFTLGALVNNIISAQKVPILPTNDQKGMSPLFDEKNTENDSSKSIVKKQERRLFTTQDALVCLLLLIVQLNSESVSQPVMRVGGTLIAALTIWQCVRKESNSLLGTGVLVFFGDISYSLYLIHWPFIVSVKYYLNIQQLGFNGMLVVAVSSILLSFLVHRYIETAIVQLPIAKSLAVSFVLIVFMLGTTSIYTNSNMDIRRLMFSPRPIGNFTQQELLATIQWNLDESTKVFMDMPCSNDTETEKWTNMTLEPQLRCVHRANGTLDVLVIGNSIAYRAFPLIRSILAGRYKTLRLYSRSNCAPLSTFCQYFTDATRIVVDRIKPDLLFIIQNQIDPYFISPFNNTSSDETISHFQSNLDYYSARSKYIVLDMPYYMHLITSVGYEVGKRLERGLSLDDLKVDRKAVQKQQGYHRTRLQALSCSNCITNDIDEVLFEGDFYYLYNRTSYRAYTGDGAHFTPEGLALIRPYYERIVEPLLRKLNN